MFRKLPIRCALGGAAALLLALGAAAPLAAQGLADMKIAIIDTERILLTSETGKKALEELRGLQTAKEEEGKAMQGELEALRDRLTEGRLSLSDERIAEMEKEMEDRAIALRRFQDDANRDLNKKRDEILARVDRAVMPIINAYGQEGAYDLIFRKFESGLIYANEGVDVTDEIIRRLDSGGGAQQQPAASGAGG